jgi:hypothetical protein
VTPSIISVDYDECDPDDSERRAFVAAEYDGDTYCVRTLSMRSLFGNWDHSITYWCHGEDEAGTQRPPAELPDDVTSAVDAELHRGRR